MHPRRRRQRRQAGHKIHPLQHNVRLAVAVERRQTVAHLLANFGETAGFMNSGRRRLVEKRILNT